MRTAVDVYTKAQAELSEIDSKIAALQQRRDALRKFVDLGNALFEAPMSLMERAYALRKPDATADAPIGALGMLAARERTAKARILAACTALIESQGSTTTRDLVTALEAAGVEISGADKINTLSVMLSKSELFIAGDRKVGWSLRSHEEKPPLGVDAPAGADVVGHP
jgi:hypothetical protein